MNKKELELHMKKACENIFKKLAENPEEMLNLIDLQDKYNNLLKEMIELKEQIKKQKETIDKAIDYIENEIDYYDDGILSEEDGTTFEYAMKVDIDYLLDILKKEK